MEDIELSPYKGFHIGVKAVPMRRLEEDCAIADGYVALIQICKNYEVVLDWCLPCPQGPWDTPAQAQREGLACASRIVDEHLSASFTLPHSSFRG